MTVFASVLIGVHAYVFCGLAHWLYRAHARQARSLYMRAWDGSITWRDAVEKDVDLEFDDEEDEQQTPQDDHARVPRSELAAMRERLEGLMRKSRNRADGYLDGWEATEYPYLKYQHEELKTVVYKLMNLEEKEPPHIEKYDRPEPPENRTTYFP